MYHPTLRSEVEPKIKTIGQADIVVGLPSYQHAANTTRVAQMALAGLRQYYPDLRAVLIHADTGADPTMRQAIAAQENGVPHRRVLTSRYTGPAGEGSATAALLDAALALDAKAIIILDAATYSITPSWILGLAHLILEGKADLVRPRYQWILPDSALNDLIAYPLFRAVWGQNVRYPTAPDFAISPRLAAAVLDEDIWETGVKKFALPLWITTYAILGEWRVVQSALGQKLVEQPPFQHISERVVASQKKFHNVISVMLSLVANYRQQWHGGEQCNRISTLTRFSQSTNGLKIPQIDPTLLLDNLALGWIEYRSLWRQVLTLNNLAQLEALAALPPDQFYFPTDLWSRIIYDFSVVFNRGECDPWQVTNSLFPLYQGRLAAYVQEIAGLSLVGCEGTVAAQVVEFEELRAYLDKRWRTYQPWEKN